MLSPLTKGILLVLLSRGGSQRWVPNEEEKVIVRTLEELGLIVLNTTNVWNRERDCEQKAVIRMLTERGRIAAQALTRNGTRPAR